MTSASGSFSPLPVIMPILFEGVTSLCLPLAQGSFLDLDFSRTPGLHAQLLAESSTQGE